MNTENYFSKDSLNLWDKESTNIGKLEKHQTLLEPQSEKWVGKLNKYILEGSITSKDVDRIEKYIKKKEGREKNVLLVCNKLVCISRIAIREKVIKDNTEGKNCKEFIGKISTILVDCSIDDILKNISDPDLFNKIIEEKLKGEKLDFESIEKIIDKKIELGDKSGINEKLISLIQDLNTEEFLKIANKLFGYKQFKKENLDEIVKFKITKTSDINDKISIINKYNNSKDIIDDVIQQFKPASPEEGIKIAEECTLSSENRSILFQNFLSAKEEVKLEEALEFHEKLGLSLEDLAKQLPLLLKICDMEKNDYLANVKIKEALTNPQVNCHFASHLCIAKPQLLVTLFGEQGSFKDIFKIDKQLEVLRNVVAQTKDFKEFEENSLQDLTIELLDKGQEDKDLLDENVFSCLVAINKRDHIYCIENMVSSDAICGIIDTPLLLALQREEGRAETTTYSDISSSWRKEKKEQYLDALLSDPSTQQLALTRIDTGNQQEPSERIEYILENLDKIPLDDAIEAIKKDFKKLSDVSDSLLVKILTNFNLNAIKGVNEETNKKTLNIFAEEYPNLVPTLQKLIESSGKNHYALAKSLFSIAYLIDNMPKKGDQNKFRELLEKKEIQALIIQIATMRKPDEARFFLMNRFMENISKPSSDDDAYNLIEDLKATQKQVEAHKLIKLQVSPFYHPFQKGLGELFGANKDFISDTDYLPTILETLQDIHRDPLLTESEKKYLVDFILGKVPSQVMLDSKQIKKNLSSVKAILRLGGANYLCQASLEKAFEGDHETLLNRLGGQCLSELMKGHLSDTVSLQLIEKINKSRDFSWVLNIAVKLNMLDSDKKDAHLKMFAEALKEDVEGQFVEERFNKSPHLLALAKKLEEKKQNDFIEEWKKPLSEEPLTVAQLLGETAKTGSKVLNEQQVAKYEVFFTDDFLDLAQMGTEVVGSCLNIKTGKSIDVMTILGNAIDGKTRMLAVKTTQDPQQPLQGRVMLRLLWDEEGKTPVIIMEGIRTRKPGDQEEAQIVDQALLEASIKVAEKLKVPLICGFTVKPQPDVDYEQYPHQVQSLAPNRSPSEKFDPLEEQGEGAVERTPEELSGLYTLKKTNTIWKP
ncbi:hypothetical protein [Candidatus Protochlamydia amoebophila]|uniref:Uncharacterized protein n=1 Tax=Protochlamydia amoebophila (strain UWE25) TaxID=264201 RepID=A0A2P9H9U5_PARUW|nr:hypothetical protein [Candidatus Protochlamydia amoebophila]SPJ31779.1 unnamed protein product [Candidatus Protochlamydia amoebophila UWE25]